MRKALGPERDNEMLGRGDLARASERLEGNTPQEILGWAVDVYGDDLSFSVSFGNPEGMVLLDMLSRITDVAQVFTLDTGFLFEETVDRKSTRLNSSHANISYAVFCLKKIDR